MASLNEFINEGAVTVADLAAPTLSELRRVLLREQFHVLHYMGHGRFTAPNGGVLVFTDRAGCGMPVTGEQLSVMLRDHTSLQLAVLNACEAGRTDPADPFGGIADTLVRRGIPAVIAMQFEISDVAAIEFAPALYGALAAGRPVDAAVAEARKAECTRSARLNGPPPPCTCAPITPTCSTSPGRPAFPTSRMAPADRATPQGNSIQSLKPRLRWQPPWPGH